MVSTTTGGPERVTTPTRFEAFVIANKIHRRKLAYATQYRADYIRDIRRGLTIPRPEVMEAIAAACTKLLGRLVTVPDLFDVEEVGRDAQPLTCSLFAIYLMRGNRVVAYVPEIPGAEAEGATIAEAKRRLGAALEDVLAANRDAFRIACADATAIHREPVLSVRKSWRGAP